MTGKIHSINHETCLRCCRCVNICPMLHLDLIEGSIREIDDPLRNCMRCGHCMAVCPTESIVVHGYSYSDFDKLPDELPKLDDFLMLLKARRSVRRYQNKPVSRELIDKILNAATTAPFGMPPTSVEVLVVLNREEIRSIRNGVLETYKQWISLFENPLTGLFVRMQMSKGEAEQLRNRIIPLVRGIMRASEHGRDFLTYDAPAMLLFHADRDTPAHEHNCVIAMTYAMIAAEGLGLGTCIVGLIPPAIDRNRSLRKKLEIPKNNKVIGSLVLGHPSVTYNRTIPRQFKNVKWME